MDSLTVMSFPRKSSTPGEMCAVELDSITGMSFPRKSSTLGEMCEVELEFMTVMGCAEDWDYIRPAWLAGSSVCARTVTGSLLFRSPHRLVRSCLRSAFSLFGGLTILIYSEGAQIFRRITIL